MKGGRIPVQSVRVVAKDEFKVKKRMRRGKQERNEGEISENWQFINDENKDYKNMPKTGIEPELFIHASMSFVDHASALTRWQHLVILCITKIIYESFIELRNIL